MWGYRNKMTVAFRVHALRADRHGHFAFLQPGDTVTVVGAPYEEKPWGQVVSILEHVGPFPADAFRSIPAP